MAATVRGRGVKLGRSTWVGQVKEEVGLGEEVMKAATGVGMRGVWAKAEPSREMTSAG